MIKHGLSSTATLFLVLGIAISGCTTRQAEESQETADEKTRRVPSKKQLDKYAVAGDVDFPMMHNIDTGDLDTFVEARGWKETNFIGKGDVTVDGDTVVLAPGHDMTGITWRGPLARINYEITLEAKRVEGYDFFCGLTFPYKDDPCSLILGGWGGTCVGLSSIDFYDAYNNETAQFMTFEMDRWYRIRLRATDTKIEAWIDDRQIVDLETTGRDISIRWEVDKSKPLGIATWQTGGAIRNIRFRVLSGS